MLLAVLYTVCTDPPTAHTRVYSSQSEHCHLSSQVEQILALLGPLLCDQQDQLEEVVSVYSVELWTTAIFQLYHDIVVVLYCAHVCEVVVIVVCVGIVAPLHCSLIQTSSSLNKKW